MADKKVTRLEAFRLRRRVELRDFPLAAFYPQNQSSIPLPAITPDMQSLHTPQRDDPKSPENVAKPWKKPWDK
jgi:hypothetical protein